MINNKQNGINIITKQEIERLFRSKTDTAAKIINVLRSMTNPFKDKKHSTDPDITNDFFKPGIMVPTPVQINNFLNNTLKPKLYGGTNFNYADLAKWALKEDDIPDDEFEDVPFVIGHSIYVDDHVPVNSQIRISMSTRRLLKTAMKRNHLCADATYKLLYKGN
jgi:hypothetical protein